MAEAHMDSRIHEQAHPTSSLLFVDEVTDLTAIYDEATNIVTLRRTPSSDLIAEAKRAAEELGSKRFEISADDQGAALAELEGYPHLAADVQLLAEILTDLTECDSVGIRISRLTKAMCPRFHVDRVMLRLVVTYNGPGTEFVANEHINRRYLGGMSREMRDELGGLFLVPDCVQRAQAFDLVALKGTLWPGNENRGAVHRSPAVSMDSVRLVMTLDSLVD